jgi:hypothetical protein
MTGASPETAHILRLISDAGGQNTDPIWLWLDRDHRKIRHLSRIEALLVTIPP